MKTLSTKFKFIFNTKKLLSTLVLISIYSMSNAQILNGSFELDPLSTVPAGPSAYATYGTSASFTNWTNTSTTSDINLHHSSHWNMGSAAGDYHIDLNKTGQIQQTGITLTAGTNYALNFSTSLHAVMTQNSTATADFQLVQTGGTGIAIPLTTISKTKTSAYQSPEGWVAYPTINFTPTVSGTYSLRVRGLTSDYSNGGVLVDNFSITQTCLPFTASITGAALACAGQNKILTASPSGMTYTWSPTTATTQSFSTGALTATQTYTVTVKNSNNCTATASHTVTVVPPCAVAISFDKKIVCKDSATLTANVSGTGCTTNWANNTKKVGPGTYTVIATNAAGCTSSASITVEKDPCCYDVEFCYYIQNKSFIVQSVTPNTNTTGCTYLYKWTFGDGTSSNLKIPTTKTYLNEGDYNVCLQVKKVCANSTDTCCMTICKTIHLVPLCNSATINADMDYSLIGMKLIPAKGVFFKAPVGTQMTISYGTPLLPSVTVPITVLNSIPTPTTSITQTYTQPGTYEYCVTLRYVNAKGDSCMDSRCKTIIVDTPCATEANFAIRNCTSGNGFEFRPTGNAANALVTFDFGDGQSNTSVGNTNISHTYATAGIYQVCMTATKGKCTSRTCFYVYANPIEFINCTSQPIPNLAKPSGEEISPNEFKLATDAINNKLTSIAFPNPAMNELNVIMNALEAKNVSIEIMAIDGKIIYTSSEKIGTENSKLKINTSSFENGMYLIRIKSNDQMNLHKIMIAH
jgi:PKD repeat protein